MPKIIREITVNLKVLKWLLAHKDALLQIVEIGKGYSKSLPYLQQWEIVDKIARIVIPILEAEAVTPKVLAHDDIFTEVWADDALTDDPREVQILQAGVEVQALSVDWKTLVETILPLVVAILKALLRDEK
jgi:hypothetical protein